MSENLGKVTPTNAATVRALRQAYWAHGFRPVTVWSPGAQNSKGEPLTGAGKRPVGLEWREKALADPPAAVTGAVSNVAANTGILCDGLAVVDVDVPVAELADQIVHCIERWLGPTPLVRIGRAPKILLVYRRSIALAKLSTPELYLPDDTKVQVEILGDGQQFVADGIHPETGEPYKWTNGSPAEVERDELPIVTADELRELLATCEALLRGAGGREKVAVEDHPKRRAGAGANGNDFFRNVNNAALTDLAVWVETLFPRARYQPRTGAYRVSSASLGRSLEEDLSIHPDGIWDFGLRKSLTAIDLVMEHGDESDAITAAKWLCTKLGRTPESLGWRTPQANGHDPKAEDPSSTIAKPVVQRRITCHTGLRHVAADQGLEALGAARIPFYQRGGALVRVCRIKAKTSDKSTIHVPGIVPVRLPLLRRALGQAAYWERLNKDGEVVRIDPPKEVAEQIAEMIEEWPFPPLAGVIGCPSLRPDGSLLDQPGYDQATGLMLENSIRMPPIPMRPSKDQALTALQLLEELLTGFPFSTDYLNGQTIEASRAVALSQLMTPIVRAAMEAAPMHLTTAPEAGSGKSYLADLTAMLAFGERCPVLALAPREDETEKRLIGAALSGMPIIDIDNASRVLAGDFLAQATERPVLQLRRLGSSEPFRIDNSFTVIANGNNAAVAADQVRRTLTCRLDANREDPENREFKTNPLVMIRQNRGKYVAAILTIARAGLEDGLRLPRIASYEGWSDCVRSPLVWLGCADPAATIAKARDADPVRADRRAVFAAWKDLLGDQKAYVVADLVNHAKLSQTLYSALLAVATDKDDNTKISAARLGKWLKKNEDVVVDKHKLTVDRNDKSRPKWQLTDVASA
jgi:hypothetical protein